VSYSDNLEVEITCQRCWKLLSDPQIATPCGDTVCNACLLPGDEGAASEVSLPCGCTVHEGVVPSDVVTGAVDRWAELDRVTTDLEYAIKTLGVRLLPCFAKRSDTGSVVATTATSVRESRIRLAQT
jgi:hypothetical protein